MTKIPVVDRSRLVEGMGRCEHKRYLEYNYLGTGLRPKGQFIPLATGTFVHEIIANVLLNPYKVDEFEAYTKLVSTAYIKLVTEKGFFNIDDPTQVEQLVKEQAWLIEALGWVFIRAYLPWILDEFSILSAEQEEYLILGCSCGLLNASNDKSEHEKRDCKGVCLMSRPDLILQRKSDGEVLSLDAKTVNDAGYSWRQLWENSMQLTLQLIAAEQRLEKPIVGSYVIGLVKGKRDKVYYKEENSPLYQNSPLCYVYYREVPFGENEIQYFYDYVDEEGMNRKATTGKGFSRTPAWDISTSPKDWVYKLPDEILAKCAVLLGPFEKPKQDIIDKTLVGIYGNEIRWNQRLEALQEQGPEFLDYYFPKSWECKRYNSVCPMLPVCMGDLKDPIESGRFENRVANHPLEIIEVNE